MKNKFLEMCVSFSDNIEMDNGHVYEMWFFWLFSDENIGFELIIQNSLLLILYRKSYGSQ